MNKNRETGAARMAGLRGTGFAETTGRLFPRGNDSKDIHRRALSAAAIRRLQYAKDSVRDKEHDPAGGGAKLCSTRHDALGGGDDPVGSSRGAGPMMQRNRSRR